MRPYDGPFPVLARVDKHFDISKDGKAVRVSLDRLKPAFSPQTVPRLSQDPCVSEQQDPHALQEDHTAIMGDAVGPDRAARSDDAQGIAPAPAPSPLSDASPPQVRETGAEAKEVSNILPTQPSLNITTQNKSNRTDMIPQRLNQAYTF